MSGGGGSGPRAREAATARSNSRLTSAGVLAAQLASIWRTRSVSAARWARSCLDRLVIRTSRCRAGGAGLTGV
jgi:hypothetical protein